MEGLCLSGGQEGVGREEDSKNCHKEIQGRGGEATLPMWGELLLPRGRGGNFPGTPEVKTPGFHCKGPEPWSGKLRMPSRYGKKKKKSLTEAEAGASQDGMTSALPGTERSHRTEGGVESPDARLTSPWLSAHRTTVS